MKEECGVFGVFDHHEAAQLTYLGLYALQHRGQESAGIVSLDAGGNFFVVKEMGLVSDVFNPENISYLKGRSAIGHVRYSTTGSNNINNIQPLYSKTAKGKLAIAHNGNLTNAYSLYQMLKNEGALFQSTVDSEVMLHMIARSKSKTMLEAFKEVLPKVEGAYSLVCLGEDYLLAARDPYGFRPLVLGKLDQGFIVASETCALDLIGATYVREINPGEVIYIDKNGLQSHKLSKKPTPAFCVFEHVYFSRPDSIVFGDSVHLVRKAFGRMLAKEYPVDADFVMAIPDSGMSAALGYAECASIPYEIGMTRNHYIGRTFIQPSQKIRDFGVRVKLNPIRSVLEGKRVVVVDDSLVRGTTSRQRVAAIRKAGAKEVHLRISCPPHVSPCFYGIDFPSREELIAYNKSIEKIKEYLEVDSLGYLTEEGLLSAVSFPKDNYCTACFTGKYPTKIMDEMDKYKLERKW